NVTNMSYAAARNLGLLQQNPFGLVLLQSALVKTMTIDFPTPLRFARSLRLSVKVSEPTVVQVLANVMTGSVGSGKPSGMVEGARRGGCRVRARRRAAARSARGVPSCCPQCSVEEPPLRYPRGPPGRLPSLLIFAAGGERGDGRTTASLAPERGRGPLFEPSR